MTRPVTPDRVHPLQPARGYNLRALWTYRLSDCTLRSNVPLPELPHSEDQEPEYTFEMLGPRDGDPVSADWFHHWRDSDDRVCLSFARHDRGYLLRSPEFADFFVSADGRAIRCHPEPGIPAETLRHLLLDQVFPLALSHRGRRLVHASAVASATGAVAFVGMAGQGKSTLAACLAQRGFEVLADDGLVLEEKDGELLGAPTYPGLRLWPDSVAFLFGPAPELPPVAHYAAKKRVLTRGGGLTFCLRAVPVKKVYVLVPREEVDGSERVLIEALSPREAFLTLIRHGYRLDIGDRAALRKDFEWCARLARRRLFYRLTFPRGFSGLPLVREAVVTHFLVG